MAFRPKAPSRGLWVPWAGSLWHKRAGVATLWAAHFITIWINCSFHAASTRPVWILRGQTRLEDVYLLVRWGNWRLIFLQTEMTDSQHSSGLIIPRSINNPSGGIMSRKRRGLLITRILSWDGEKEDSPCFVLTDSSPLYLSRSPYHWCKSILLGLSWSFTNIYSFL